MFRVPMLSFRLACYPITRDHVRVAFQCEQYDMLNWGVNRITAFFWQTLSKQVLPLVINMQERYAGSPMEAELNGSSERQVEIREALLRLHSNIECFLRQRA